MRPTAIFKGDVAFTGPGKIVNSHWMDGMTIDHAKADVIAKAEAEGWGEGQTQYRLRDWGVSRQRYWGTPIPIIHCDTCGAVPVPECTIARRSCPRMSLSISPAIRSTGTRLGRRVDCPKCHQAARRETDTLDTFVDSAAGISSALRASRMASPLTAKLPKNGCRSINISAASSTRFCICFTRVSGLARSTISA